VKREEYCVKEDKSLWDKELKMVKIFLFFSDFGWEYLRVWLNSYLVEEKFRRRLKVQRELVILAEIVCSPPEVPD
jgi:hypothetical protein